MHNNKKEKNPENVRRGKRSKQKGSQWERDLSNIFKERTGLENIKRGIGQARGSGEVADVANVPGWWIEAKCGKSTNSKKALKQAVAALAENKAAGMKPVAICRDDFQKATVTLYLDDFLDLVYGIKVEMDGIKK